MVSTFGFSWLIEYKFKKSFQIDILKETPKTHRDHELLSKAIASLKEVMTHINEDKRKIENQLAMFVLINDIENCPVDEICKKLLKYQWIKQLFFFVSIKGNFAFVA